MLATKAEWQSRVEDVRKQHNGVFSVELFLGHDGHNVCVFRNYDRVLAEGNSGRSMDEAVDRCIETWRGNASRQTTETDSNS